MATKSKSAARCVDPLSRSSTSAEIFVDENNLVWNAMLNLTDITYGHLGNNKFYSVQLIEDFGSYKVFRKWGRVGAASPQSSLEQFGADLNRAKAAFSKRFAEKSGNRWPLTGAFEKKKGKYHYVELADEDEEEEADADDTKMEDASTSTAPKCSLPDQVQELLTLIGDQTVIAKEMSALNFDLKRMPLGRLSKSQISQGYTILQRLSDVLTEIDEIQNPPAPAPAPAPVSTPAAAAPAPTTTTGRSTRRRASAAAAAAVPTATAAASAPAPKKKKLSKADSTRLAQLKGDINTLTNDFYSLIPHDFGRSLPTKIVSLDMVKEKIELLGVLTDLEISEQLRKEEKRKAQEAGAVAKHPLDAKYESINTQMEPLDENSEEYKRLVRYLENTQAPSQAYYKLQIKSILKIARPAEQEKRKYFEDVDNHRLLWHGSRLSNAVGILSQGLRIAPPEAPCNGYNFGKGVYFADSVTKSASYCSTSYDRPRAVIFLAEVALGKSYEAPHPKYLGFDDVHKHGCMSTLGVGRLAPKEATFEHTEDGVVVPVGQIETKDSKGGMLFNEFIVYKQEQVRLRYLITMDFDYSARHSYN